MCGKGPKKTEKPPTLSFSSSSHLRLRRVVSLAWRLLRRGLIRLLEVVLGLVEARPDGFPRRLFLFFLFIVFEFFVFSR